MSTWRPACYAYAPKTGEVKIDIAVNREPLTVTISFTDGGRHYNPLETEEPDLNLSAEERQIGGLGIFLVKKNVDEVKYEYIDNKNVLTVFKKL